jgi:nitroreductase
VGAAAREWADEAGDAGDDLAGVAEPMRSRWSPSVFDPDHTLDRDEVLALLRAARWAPSAGNGQWWGFLVAPRGSEAHDVVVEHLSRGNAGWVPRASLVLVAGTQVGPDPDGPDGLGGPGPGSADYARYDLGQAAAHVTLQARAMGLDAHQFAGFDREAVAAALGVPGHVSLMAGIAVGRHLPPDAAAADDRISEADRERERRPRTRKPMTEIAHGPRWGEAWTTS